MLQQEDFLSGSDEELDFGMLLKILRSQKKVRQRTIVALLPGWTQTAYTRLENGEIAPRYDQLLPIYYAFQQAGISFSLTARQNFIKLARKKIKEKKTHRDTRTDAEWAELRYHLACMDHLPDTPTHQSVEAMVLSRHLLAETNHLISREPWREELLGFLNRSSPSKKLVIVRGPTGIGKSSELNWLATHLLQQSMTSYQVISCDFSPIEQTSGPGGALDVFLGILLAELGSTNTHSLPLTVEERTGILLENLEQATTPLVVLVDNGECLLEEHGTLAPGWERFLSRFLRNQHQTTIILATKQWPGWFGGEHVFVAETALPPLSLELGVLLLQQLGLDVVPVPVLREVYTSVGGIPLCLEWVAALVKQPFYIDDWEEFGTHDEYTATLAARARDMTQAVQRLLAEPHVFGGTLAEAIAPILDKIISQQYLSSEANHLLNVLSVATVPLARPALAVVCVRGPHPVKELRRASLLVAYPGRVQLLPMVASAVIRHLTAGQIHESERLLIQAYTAWLQEGFFHDSEKGAVITELTVLLLKQHRLLEAAQLLIQYGWLSFALGHGTPLGRLAREVMGAVDWQAEPENECGGILLSHYLGRFLGEKINTPEQAEAYQRVHQIAKEHNIPLRPATEVHLMHHLLLDLINRSRFPEAQALFGVGFERMQSLETAHPATFASLLSDQGYLLGKWGEYEAAQGHTAEATDFRERAVAVYRRCVRILREKSEGTTPLERSTLSYHLAKVLNDLGYYLVCLGRPQEAIAALQESIQLKRQGFSKPGSLAMSLGELAQALARSGHFQEALRYNLEALDEIQRLAATGHAIAREEIPVLEVDRARLLMRVGQLDEAEQLLNEASGRIRESRRAYRMFAREARDEIALCRAAASTLGRIYLDWRWYARYRDAISYDPFGWLAHAGPFTEEEQQEWEGLLKRSDEEAARRKAMLIKASRDRELAAAIEERREPQLSYPSIPIEELKERLAALIQLRAEVEEHEPNTIVRRLYCEAIEEQLWYLYMIQATYEGDVETFWSYNRRIHAEPTVAEMEGALHYLGHMIGQGMQHPETAEISKRLHQQLHNMQLSPHLLASFAQAQQAPEVCEQRGQKRSDNELLPAHRDQRLLSPFAVKHFFEAILQEYGFDGWQVQLDHATNNLRIETNVRTIFLAANKTMSVARVRELLSHEIESHVFRAEAGKQSPLALLFLGTKGALVTEEGLALYYDQQTAQAQGTALDESAMSSWIGTLATGLACGVLTAPQTFYHLFAFLEPLYLLSRLLPGKEEKVSSAAVEARRLALNRCLRTYRGVPDLSIPGVCYAKDAIYLRGYRAVSRALREDVGVLERLMVGVVALEHLADLAELGIVAPLNRPQWLAHRPDLDEFILSFEGSEQKA
jgi:tetratricopeptide (TPR) repeat protein